MRDVIVMVWGGVLAASLGGLWAGHPTARAEEPSAKPRQSVENSPAAQRAAWEAALRQPAALDFEGRADIRLKDLFRLIRERHGIPVSLDHDRILPLASALQLVSLDRLQDEWDAESTAPQATSTITSPPPGSLDDAQGYRVSPDRKEPAQDPAGEARPEPLPPSGEKPNDKPSTLPGPSVSAASTKADPGNSAPEPTPGALFQRIRRHLGELTVPVDVIDDDNLSVEAMLLKAVQSALPINTMFQSLLTSEELVLPFSITQAVEWDLVVGNGGVVLTTRIQANLHKETRVYRIKHLEKAGSWSAGDLRRVIITTIRPWSWKPTSEEPLPANSKKAGEAVKKAEANPMEHLLPPMDPSVTGSLMPVLQSQVLQLANVVSDNGVQLGDNIKINPSDVDLAEFQRFASGLLQLSISAIQGLHHAEPPTGVIETLPGVLIISQSQSAHREIAELLEALEQSAKP
jgi:hypothetical protein